MTALAEVERIAAAVVPPVGAIDVVAVVDHTPGGKLPGGSPTGLGGRTRYGAAWSDGLVKSKPIALFDRASDAYTLIDLLTGRALRSAPRSAAAGTLSLGGPAEGGADPSARPVRRSRSRWSPPDTRRPEGGPAAQLTAGAPGATTSEARCAACGRQLLASRTGQRRKTCDDACRQAFHRGDRAPVAGVVTLESIDLLSRLPDPSGIAAGDAGDADQLALLGRTPV